MSGFLDSLGVALCWLLAACVTVGWGYFIVRAIAESEKEKGRTKQ